MPVSWTTLFRLLVLLLVALHVFNMYCLSRVVEESVGRSAVAIAGSGFFALAMLIPLAWAVALPDVPEMVRRQRGRKRWAQGRCPGCGYVLLAAGGEACPECGTKRREPEPFSFGWATAARFLGLALGAWVLGSVVAESWIAYDEAGFRQEAQTQLAGTSAALFSRPRRWPMEDARLYYTADEGVSAFPPRGVLVEELAPHLLPLGDPLPIERGPPGEP